MTENDIERLHEIGALIGMKFRFKNPNTIIATIQDVYVNDFNVKKAVVQMDGKMEHWRSDKPFNELATEFDPAA